jgi:hypothetical protein
MAYENTAGAGATVDAKLALAETALQPGDDAIELGSGDATLGQLLQADGAGGTAWGTAPSGSGEPGPAVELQTSATHVQWRVVGDAEWINLVALSELTGPQGDPGTDGDDGADGPAVELQVNSTHVQWRVVGAATWIDLVALSTITGPQGEPGVDGVDGQDASETPIVGVSSSGGALATELNGSLYVIVPTENVTTWTAPIPSGGNAATTSYSATLKIKPPVSGGPFTFTPGAWYRLGGLETISIAVDDAPIVVELRLLETGFIGLTAVQSVAI